MYCCHIHEYCLKTLGKGGIFVKALKCIAVKVVYPLCPEDQRKISRVAFKSVRTIFLSVVRVLLPLTLLFIL